MAPQELWKLEKSSFLAATFLNLYHYPFSSAGRWWRQLIEVPGQNFLNGSSIYDFELYPFDRDFFSEFTVKGWEVAKALDGQAAAPGGDLCFHTCWEFSPPPSSLSVPHSNPHFEVQIPVWRPKSQPWGPNPSLKSQILASRPRFGPWDWNLGLETTFLGGGNVGEREGQNFPNMW